jgi:uncharacterized protein with GYD domain
MALTKAQVKEILSAAGVDTEHMSDAVTRIIDGHTASIEALREERDKYKADSEKFADTKKELEDVQKKLAEAGKDAYKVKYEAIKEEFAEYKNGIEAEKTKQGKLAAYKNLLKKIGISDKRIDAVAKIADLEALELDDSGNIKGESELSKTLKEEWEDFIVTEGEKGAKTPKPPAKDSGTEKLTKEDIAKIKDTAERQEAIKTYMNENGGW